jgi:hypothetical protein
MAYVMADVKHVTASLLRSVDVATAQSIQSHVNDVCDVFVRPSGPFLRHCANAQNLY